ncbi:DUF4306 domain-containing protein [Bacillus sp. AK031]
MNRIVVQFGLGLVFLLFSIFATWYEGSALLNSPYEWKYSTPFSGLVLKASDISPLDFFVYAIKFKPTFPIVMFVSSIYLIIIGGLYILKNKSQVTLFLAIIAAGLILLGWQMFSATTAGAQIISYVLLSSGTVCLVLSLLYHIGLIDRNHALSKRG